jgi:hypothetical protein
MTEVFPGKDGCVRVVRLETELGEVAPPVLRVYHLEVRNPAVMPAEKEQRTLQDMKLNSPVLRKTLTTRSGRQVNFPTDL